MNEVSVFSIRRENLVKLIATKFDGNNAAFSRAAGKHQNLINLILSKNPELRRNMGEKLARDIERTLGLPSGFFDVVRQDSGTGATIYTFPIVRFDGSASAGMEKILLGADVAARHLDSPSSMSSVQCCYMTSDEMSPAIHRDDLLFVDTASTDLDKDGVFVILRGNEAYVRRVRRLLTGGIRISADGDPDGTIESTPGKFKAAGRVVGLMKFSKP